MRTMAVANIKGGVGKTNLSIHLATGLAMERRVLLIDADPQGSASNWIMGKRDEAKAVGLAEVLDGETLEQKHVTKVGEKLDLLQSSTALRSMEAMITPRSGCELILRDALRNFEGPAWDYVVIDCPPAVGKVVLNAICASDWVLAPVRDDLISLEGLPRIEAEVDKAVARLGAKTRVLGYVLIGSNERTVLTQDARDLINASRPGRLFTAAVRASEAGRRLRTDRATAWGGSDERILEDYRAVMKETVQRMGVQ